MSASEDELSEDEFEESADEAKFSRGGKVRIFNQALFVFKLLPRTTHIRINHTTRRMKLAKIYLLQKVLMEDQRVAESRNWRMTSTTKL